MPPADELPRTAMTATGALGTAIAELGRQGYSAEDVHSALVVLTAASAVRGGVSYDALASTLRERYDACVKEIDDRVC